MAAPERDDDRSEPLSEAQRLSLLEQNVSLNRILSLLVAAALIIALSVGLTILIFHSLNKGPTGDYVQQVSRLELEISTLKNEIQTQNLRMQQLQSEIPALRTALDNSSAASFQKVLLQQEVSYQQFLNTLKDGMSDLAYMVQGSRTWLEHYKDEIDKAIQRSLSRQRDLQQVQTGQVLVEPAAQP